MLDLMCLSQKIFALSLAMAFAFVSLGSGVEFSFSGTRSNYFGSEEVSFRFLKTPPLSGRVIWRLAAGSRTVVRGEKRVDIYNQGDDTCFSLICQMPPVKDGAIIPLDLTASFTPLNGSEAIEINRRIWLFSHDVSFGQENMLKEREIHLFDPNTRTYSLLEKAKIPFKPIYNLEILASLTNGTVVVGTDLSFQEHRSLSHILVDAAQRGIDVLLLTPQDGKIQVPLGDDDINLRPHRCLFEGREIINKLDKRFDGNLFEGKQIVLTENNNIVIMPRNRAEHCWQWMMLDYSPSGGKLVICGFDILEKWDSSPTSRYLLIKILEYFGKD